MESVLTMIMYISCFVFSVSLSKYLYDYRIFQMIYERLRGRIDAYDRIRREQMKKDTELDAGSFVRTHKVPFLSRLYNRIDKTGLSEMIPGFSEVGFIILLIGLDITVFFIGNRLWNPIIGVILALVALIMLWYSLSLMAYNRRIKVEDQLLSLANACSSASLQYSSIIDIFGATYEQLDEPLKGALEECYIEAKKTQDEEMALNHLKEKFNSKQLAFVIDNFKMCSENTGNYHKTAKEIASAVMIYSRSHERKTAILRNAKMLITIMFFLSIGIAVSLGTFLGDPRELFFENPASIIILIAMGVVYFYGMNARAEGDDTL